MLAQPARPSLTWTDAWLLASLLVSAPPGQPVDLQSLLSSADHLNVAIPTFDELSFGLARLEHGGWLTVESSQEDGFRFTSTQRAADILGNFSTTHIRDLPSGVSSAIGAMAHPREEAEDRSLGRLPALEPDDLAAANQANRDFMENWIRERRRKP